MDLPVTARAQKSDVRATEPGCFHCGTPCRNDRFTREEKFFCCQGCLTVFELLTENGLPEFYILSEAAGVLVTGAAKQDQYKFLDEPAVRERLVDFADARLTRVTFHITAIHCIACVWLLENLFRLKPNLGQSQVNFPRKRDATLQVSTVASRQPRHRRHLAPAARHGARHPVSQSPASSAARCGIMLPLI